MCHCANYLIKERKGKKSWTQCTVHFVTLQDFAWRCYYYFRFSPCSAFWSTTPVTPTIVCLCFDSFLFFFSFFCCCCSDMKYFCYIFAFNWKVDQLIVAYPLIVAFPLAWFDSAAEFNVSDVNATFKVTTAEVLYYVIFVNSKLSFCVIQKNFCMSCF